MQRILCRKHGEEVMALPDDDPGFCCRFTLGTLKPREDPGHYTVTDLDTGVEEDFGPIDRNEYLCDSCGRKIEVGDQAVAWSAWPVGTAPKDWEGTMMTDMRVLKEVIGK